MTDEALALAFQTGLPFVGLRDHAHDPALDDLIPPAAARTARAIPLAADDDHVRLAVADPDTDLSTLAAYLTGREIDLALAPREELDAILGPPPPATEQLGAADSLAGVEAERGSEEEAEPVAAAGPDALVGERELVAEADAEPLAAADEEPAAEAAPDATADTAAEADAEPGPAQADAEPEPLGEAAEGAAAEAEPVAEAAPDLAQHAAAEADAEPEPLGDAPADGVAEPAVAAEWLGAEPAPSVPIDDHPELAGEVPSWLEPPRRGRRVLLAVVIVIVLLIAAAAVVIAFVNA